MQAPSPKHLIHGGIFLLANKMQLVGDRLTGDITSKQWFLLLQISQMEATPSLSAIAQEVDSTRQNVTKMLAPLAKKGYVRLTQDPADRRSHCVELTPRCHTRMGEISGVGQGFINRMLDGATPEDIEATGRVFLRMMQNLEEMQTQEETSL